MAGKEKVYDIDGLVNWFQDERIGKPVEALNEWQKCDDQVGKRPLLSSYPPFWESDDGSDDEFKPSDMFGEFSLKIEKFSRLGKKEFKSDVFDVNGYKWYILVFPKGCDVIDHLSLFLCVSNHTQLLPGWGHFAQFTISVVNKESKKTKFSDMLHWFCKKEHDWGYKKFMELSKLQDGFLVDDTLQIKTQVQIIRNKLHRPFCCLDHRYRRELLSVYLSHVKNVCRKFVEDHTSKLSKMINDKALWSRFCTFWLGLDPSIKKQISCERSEVLFKVAVKHFFVEKEATSALVMDSLYSGLKAIQMESSCNGRKENVMNSLTNSSPIVYVDGDLFILADDLLSILDKSARQSKAGSTVPDFLNNPTDWEPERRLMEIGRRTIEIFALSHIFSQKIEVAYKEDVAARIQEELIREEDEKRVAEREQIAKRKTADKKKG